MIRCDTDVITRCYITSTPFLGLLPQFFLSVLGLTFKSNNNKNVNMWANIVENYNTIINDYSGKLFLTDNVLWFKIKILCYLNIFEVFFFFFLKIKNRQFFY